MQHGIDKANADSQSVMETKEAVDNRVDELRRVMARASRGGRKASGGRFAVYGF